MKRELGYPESPFLPVGTLLHYPVLAAATQLTPTTRARPVPSAADRLSLVGRSAGGRAMRQCRRDAHGCGARDAGRSPLPQPGRRRSAGTSLQRCIAMRRHGLGAAQRPAVQPRGVVCRDATRAAAGRAACNGGGGGGGGAARWSTLTAAKAPRNEMLYRAQSESSGSPGLPSSWSAGILFITVWGRVWTVDIISGSFACQYSRKNRDPISVGFKILDPD